MINIRINQRRGDGSTFSNVIDVDPQDFEAEYDAHGPRGLLLARDRRSGRVWMVYGSSVEDFAPTLDDPDPLRPIAVSTDA
jgi:hypothetical protein